MSNRILLISPDVVGEQMAGPGIRYVNIAEQLSKIFSVVLLIPNNPSGRQFPFHINTLSHSILRQELKNADVVIVQGTVMARYPEIKKAGIPIVVDLYDPFILENLELRKNDPIENTLFQYDLRVIIDQLVCGDFFICSNERQMDFWIGMLTACGRVNPDTYALSPTLDHLIALVPFGISDNMLINNMPVKGHIEGLENKDKLFIWGGGIWDWLDPYTTIRAVSRIREYREDIKLVFMGIRNPNGVSPSSVAAQTSMQLAKSLDLFQTQVLFNDWTEYNERSRWLADATAGLSIHKLHLETRYAFRTRVLDYLWAGTPIISTSGDSMSDLITRHNIGWIVPPGDDVALANAMLAAASDEELFKSMKQRISEIRHLFFWSKVVEPLIVFCDMPIRQPDRHKRNWGARLRSNLLFKLNHHEELRIILRRFRKWYLEMKIIK